MPAGVRGTVLYRPIQDGWSDSDAPRSARRVGRSETHDDPRAEEDAQRGLPMGHHSTLPADLQIARPLTQGEPSPVSDSVRPTGSGEGRTRAEVPLLVQTLGLLPRSARPLDPWPSPLLLSLVVRRIAALLVLGVARWNRPRSFRISLEGGLSGLRRSGCFAQLLLPLCRADECRQDRDGQSNNGDGN
jgi:hypothetical protein